MSIPQTYKDWHTKAKYVLDTDTGLPKRVPASVIKGLNSVDCSNWNKGLVTPLFLKNWLEKFFQRLEENVNETSAACMSKLTLQTQFMLLVDVSGGTNPIFGTSFIVPISGINVDYNPTFTHSLTIALALKKYKNSDLCTKIPATQPNRTLR
jgi:hypothetical protein